MEFTEQELADMVHSSFWAGVDAARQGANMIDAFTDLLELLEEKLDKKVY